MAGFHGQTIYTKDDNPWCSTCLYAEHLTGDRLLKEGGYWCNVKGIPTEEGCKEYKSRPTDKIEVEKKEFYCQKCLRSENIGYGANERGYCTNCDDTNLQLGHRVTARDLEIRHKLGLDENCWTWTYCLPGFNVARTNCVCPHCGYNVFDRMNLHDIEPSRAIYSCNNCHYPIHTGEKIYSYPDKELWAKNSSDIKKWIKNNEIKLTRGDQYLIPQESIYKRNGMVTLVVDHKTCFFVNKQHEVVGKMLTIISGKSPTLLGVSQLVIDFMLNTPSIGPECNWAVR